MMNDRKDKINCEKKEKKCDECQIKKMISVKKKKEKKEMLITEKIIKKNENELKMIKFKQEMK